MIPGDAKLSAFKYVEESQPLDRFDDARLADLQQERELRELVARWTLMALGIQLCLMDLAFGYYTRHDIASPEFPATFRWFMAGTLGEIFAIMWVLVAYLFPKHRKSPYEGR